MDIVINTSALIAVVASEPERTQPTEITPENLTSFVQEEKCSPPHTKGQGERGYADEKQ